MKRLAVLIPIVGLAIAAFAGASLASAQGTPSVNPVSATTAINTPVAINVLSTDADSLGQFLPSTLLISQPANGSAVADTIAGTVTYTPNADFAGVDSFEYRVCDNEVSPFCGEALVTITVGGIATATATPTETPIVVVPDILPNAVNDTASTSEDTPVTISVLANDTGDPLGTLVPSSVTVVTQPASGGSATANSDGTVTYTPAASFTGQDSFEYQVCDSQATSPHCSDAEVAVSVGGSAPATGTTTPVPATTTPVPTQVAATPTEPAATATVPAETPFPTQIATQPPATATPSPATTAEPLVTETVEATPIAPSTGSGVAGGSGSTMPLALAAIVLLCAGGAVLGYTASTKR